MLKKIEITYIIVAGRRDFMKINIIGKELKVTEALNDYVENILPLRLSEDKNLEQ